MSKPWASIAAHEKQRAGGRNQHADAIGGDVRRHAGGLLVLRQALDAEGVDHDVLRRRGGGDQQRAERDQPRRSGRIAGAEEHDRRHQQDLREHQPAAAAAEPARQQRHVERVGQRRPQEFHGVGRADQREQADGAEVDAGFAHPHQQRRARQRQRQAGREAEEHHDQHARLEVDRQRVETRTVALERRAKQSLRYSPASSLRWPGPGRISALGGSSSELDILNSLAAASESCRPT